MLADGFKFTCEEQVAATDGIVSQDAKQVSEQLNSWFTVVAKLDQDVILGFDWLQSVNLQVDWVNYGVTLKYSFVAAGVLIHHTVKAELCSFKVLMYFLHANKVSNSQFTFVQQI